MRFNWLLFRFQSSSAFFPISIFDRKMYCILLYWSDYILVWQLFAAGKYLKWLAGWKGRTIQDYPASQLSNVDQKSREQSRKMHSCPHHKWWPSSELCLPLDIPLGHGIWDTTYGFETRWKKKMTEKQTFVVFLLTQTNKINKNQVFSSICTCQWHLLSGQPLKYVSKPREPWNPGRSEHGFVSCRLWLHFNGAKKN